MDTILLDTITFDCLLHRPQELSRRAITAINKTDSALISVVSLWEMANHVRVGKIQISTPFDDYINDALATFSIVLLPVDWKALLYMTSFEIVEINKPYERQGADGETIKGVKKELHKDPFDRMMLAHALALDLPLVSPDQLFPFYKPLGLQLIW